MLRSEQESTGVAMDQRAQARRPEVGISFVLVTAQHARGLEWMLCIGSGIESKTS